jgi:pimeloyl-[acyl-carrier protein] methyl ester esterase
MRLIFLNGWSASSGLLGKMVDALSKDHELIVINHLYQFSNEDINSRIDEVMTEDSVLIGWSLGGMLAMQYLQQKSARIKPVAMILLQSTPCFIQKNEWPFAVSEQDFRKLEIIVSQHHPRQFVRHFIQLMVSGSAAPEEDRSMIRSTFTDAFLPTRDVLLKGLSYLRDLDLRESLSEIDVPVYAIFGEQDVLISVEVESCLETHLKQFTSTIIAGMGHFPYGHKLDEVLQGMTDFLCSITTKMGEQEG